MTPRDKAASLYDIWHQPRDFEAIKSPHVIFGKTVENAWFIWIYVGDIAKIESLMPYPLPHVGWARRNRSIRWYDQKEFAAKINGRGIRAIT